jgi:hypothetical protein
MLVVDRTVTSLSIAFEAEGYLVMPLYKWIRGSPSVQNQPA